jgi:hypothetical protein
MKVFLERVAQLLPVLGTNILTPIPGLKTPGKRLRCKIKNLIAYGNRTPNGFVVYKGSQCVEKLRPSAKDMAKNIKQGLIDSGALVLRDGFYEFTRDVEFNSPSRAANAVRGGSSNGLTCWRDAKGQKLRDIEASE